MFADLFILIATMAIIAIVLGTVIYWIFKIGGKHGI